MATNHPGSWKVYRCAGDEDGEDFQLCDAEGHHVALVKCGEKETERLVLAAPELLEFVKQFLAQDGAPQKWGRPDSLLDIARALIDRIEETKP